MLYYHYMSVRSAAANQQPEKIIFHVDGGPPLGDLWKKLVEEVPCLETRHLDVPETVFGHKIEWILHKTDVARNDILIKEGGIYLDSDVLILRSLDPLRRYAFTMGRSTANSLSNGAMLAKPESKFLQATIDTYKEFSAEKFSGTKQAVLSVQRP
uniref:Alpha-1,4-N-acetylglucosaminyltransferase n=1 Tax=Ciona savignyi TaxID=51511 RepID=H2Z4J5_CIOSA